MIALLYIEHNILEIQREFLQRAMRVNYANKTTRNQLYENTNTTEWRKPHKKPKKMVVDICTYFHRKQRNKNYRLLGERVRPTKRLTRRHTLNLLIFVETMHIS